jgi:signal transduction histidine kinase
MSGNLIVDALYDQEGSLWVGTETGIDRFRRTKLTPIAPTGYLGSAAVAPDTNGAVWVATKRGTPAALLSVGDRIIPRLDAPRVLTCIYRDLRGGLWVGSAGLWERKGDAFYPVTLPPVQPGGSPLGREIQAVARERDGGLWVAIAFNEGVFRRRPGRGWERFSDPRLADRSPANAITTDSSGRTWLGYQRGELALVVGDSVRVFAAEEGPDVGRVLAISVYGDRVWIGGQSGVAVFYPREASGHRQRLFFRLLTAGEPLRGVSGLVETAEGELWLNGADGVTRIAAAEVRRALAEPGYQVRYERFDYRDGIEPPAEQVRPLPSAAAGTDGRIWFASAGGVAWVDPRRVQRNAMPPPVHLRALTAGGRRHFAGQAGDTVRLPPRTSALGVAYTAYSLAIPDRVRFKYRLEGLDTAWQDAGGRREAFFTNLAPGRYRFHVIASNDDGVWNTAGASLAFAIAPAWNQTWWFFALVTLTLVATPAFTAVAWQRRRARLAAERSQARFEAMLAERTRLARELHDTLLGGMAGVAMQLDTGARRLAAGDSTPAIADLLSTLASQARYVLAETRRVVGAMRAPPEGQPLYEQLTGMAQRIFAGTEIVVHLTQTGTERLYSATREAEIVSIAGEALANARNHSGCRTVWIICDSGPKELHVGVRDDGCGFDPSQPGPAGHWGLIGMRERAGSIGARLDVTSAPGAGTEVVLVLPERSGWSVLWSRLVRRNFIPQ